MNKGIIYFIVTIIVSVMILLIFVVPMIDIGIWHYSLSYVIIRRISPIIIGYLLGLICSIPLLLNRKRVKD
jgi:hypothetical protein